MNLFPAIDLVGGKAVRLIRGDYQQMTVYSDDPVAVAKGFRDAGASWLHVVDLEGARDGDTPNLETVKALIRESGLAVEVGGGIRSMETVKTYIDAGAARVIIGTAALLLSVLLSGILTHRISGLLLAIREVREGSYSHRTEIRGRDEIAQIGQEFNSLTDRLQTTENARRRFVSDASHELKTPLAVGRKI